MDEPWTLFKEPPLILFGSPDLTSTRPLRSELRRRGARVLMAPTLQEAIRIAERLRPDLLVLDEALGGTEIPDVAFHFRAAFPAAEIILLRSEASATPGGLGLSLLYSGPKQIAHESLLEIIQGAFPHRLRPPDFARGPAHTVLCVDDDRAYLASLTRLLSRHGYRVSAFDEAKVALSAIPEVTPALAILDVAMPGMGGLQMARTIRTNYGGLIPVILLSGKCSGADTAAGYLHGASHYVAKTADPRRLLDVVDYHAGNLDSQERELLEEQL